MFEILRLARSKVAEPELPKLKPTPIGLHPILDLYAISSELAHSQMEIWRVLVKAARLWAALSFLWATIAVLYAAPNVISFGEWMRWW